MPVASPLKTRMLWSLINQWIAIRRVTENLDVQGITASGSSPEILEAAGIRQAEILLP